MFKINNDNTKTTSMTAIIEFEQVIFWMVDDFYSFLVLK